MFICGFKTILNYLACSADAVLRLDHFTDVLDRFTDVCLIKRPTAIPLPPSIFSVGERKLRNRVKSRDFQQSVDLLISHVFVAVRQKGNERPMREVKRLAANTTEIPMYK